jgi:hypothetical protein
MIYQRCPPERLRGTLAIVFGIDSSPLSPVIQSLGELTTLKTYEELGRSLLRTAANTYSVVELCADGSFKLITVDVSIDVRPLAQAALVYSFQSGVEHIYVKEHVATLPKLSPVLVSNFATPTLSTLEEALSHYANTALETQCRILADIWEGGIDGPRIVLVNRPESIMRDSLIQSLQNLVRDASVRPEQNTDETKPVDIRVDWYGSGASALIEVKWLGKSTAVPRTPKPEITYTEYGPPRAQEGADQLADYMDRDRRHSAASSPRGYLVVFDARRRNAKGANDSLTKEDALYFLDKEIDYDPDHSRSRDDFSKPYRFYLRPRESHFLTPSTA